MFRKRLAAEQILHTKNQTPSNFALSERIILRCFEATNMELSEATTLIQNDHLVHPGATEWADLGCGSGLFTYALAQMLDAGSVVYAVDKDPVRLQSLHNPGDVDIRPLQLDFITTPLPWHNLDGILMANSLHFVSDKKLLIRQLSHHLKHAGNFLIVEYDTDKPVPQWVPYPVSFRSLQALFGRAGFTVVEKLGERTSAYGRANMYAAWVGR